MPAFACALVAAVLGWALTGAVRRYALARAVLDVPNERSSHTRPTPRGGGLAIAVVLLGGVAAIWATGLLATNVALAVGGGGLLVALVGWVDDHGHVPAYARFGIHLVAAVWAVAWLGGWPRLEVGTASIHLGAAGAALAVIGIVWLTNLYNFMDGIDGIAGGQAVVAGGAGGALLLASGNTGLGAVAWTIAGASLGFLVWNRPPARIFMGDVGSGLLGYCFAVLAVASDAAGGPVLAVWLLLLGVFLFDATVTLLRRAWRGERWYEAHRQHAYQRAVQAGWSHARATGVAIVCAVILAMLAAAGWMWPRSLLAMLVAGTVLLAVTYAWVETRRPMQRRSTRPPSTKPRREAGLSG